MTEGARRATPADLPALVRLAGEARRHLAAQPRGGPERLAELRPADTDEAALAALLDDPAAAVAVGTYDGVVVAYAVAVERRRGDLPVAVLDELFVEDGGRGVGVGEALFELVLAWATERGCAGVEATALPGDRETKNFFERFGLTARLLVVHRAL